MDTSDDIDRVVPLPVPDPDGVTPLPIVVAKGGSVILSYLTFLAHKNKHIIASFHVAYEHRFGPPGAAGLAAHPLAARGLKRDGAFEVKGSSRVRDAFGGKGRHYVF